jgi:5'-methylthioadenosine phosphorylase
VAAHAPTAQALSALRLSAVLAAADRRGIVVHRGLTCACVEGHRPGTQAESHFLRLAACHLVGMSNVPEAFLAREAPLAYATVGSVTDFGCWLGDPAQHVGVVAIFEPHRQTLAKAGLRSTSGGVHRFPSRTSIRRFSPRCRGSTPRSTTSSTPGSVC